MISGEGTVRKTKGASCAKWLAMIARARGILEVPVMEVLRLGEPGVVRASRVSTLPCRRIRLLLGSRESFLRTLSLVPIVSGYRQWIVERKSEHKQTVMETGGVWSILQITRR